MKTPIQPGDLWKAHQGGHKGLAHQLGKRMKASGPIKTSGSFGGKSNALGHGGRAAQLVARGVPGGVIGNLARAAHAAPGQANYHGGKKKRKGLPKAQAMAFKKKRKVGTPGKEGDTEMKLKRKGGKAGFPGVEGDKEEKRKGGGSCMKCKGAHATSEHSKHTKKKASRVKRLTIPSSGVFKPQAPAAAAFLSKTGPMAAQRAQMGNPNSPQNYGRAMNSAQANSKILRKRKAKKKAQ